MNLREEEIVKEVINCCEKILGIVNRKNVNFKARAENAPIIFKSYGLEGFLLYYSKENANNVKEIIKYLMNNESHSVPNVSNKAYDLYLAALTIILSGLNILNKSKIEELLNNYDEKEFILELLKLYLETNNENKYVFEKNIFIVMKYLKLISKGLFKDKENR